MFEEATKRVDSLRLDGTRPYWEGRASAGTGPHVTVIGAGIIGLTSAAALRRAGRMVTVVDAGAGVANGASRGNGCQLSYGYVAPLAQPRLFAELPKLLFSPGAPLQIRPSLDPAQWRWMIEFLAACRTSIARRSTVALLGLAHESRVETERWMCGSDAAALDFGQPGKLVLLPTSGALENARRQMKAQSRFGPAQRLVTEAECMAIEPALSRFRGRIAGAIYTPSECVVDSLALCRDLEQQLRRQGVAFNLGVRVTALAQRGGRVTQLQTTAGPRPVEDIVLATGSTSAALARTVGFRLPVVPLKGYSITVPVRIPHAAPAVSITDAAQKVVYARLGNRLRVAGMAELRGDDHRLDPRRIAQLIEHTRRAFGDAVDLDASEPWTGMRPVTPSSIPLIERAPEQGNLFVNVGQGALGLTLAFGSALRLANLMTHSPSAKKEVSA